MVAWLLTLLRLISLDRCSLLILIGVWSNVACEFVRRGDFLYDPEQCYIRLIHATEQIA